MGWRACLMLWGMVRLGFQPDIRVLAKFSLPKYSPLVALDLAHLKLSPAECNLINLIFANLTLRILLE